MLVHQLSFFAVLLFLIVPTLPMHLWIRVILRIGYGVGGLISLGCNTAVLAIFFAVTLRPPPGWRYMGSNGHGLFDLAFLMIAANLAVALVVKLYFAIFLDQLSPQEKTPGIVGFRAWFSPAKVLAVVTVAACAAFALDCDYLGVTVAGLAMLLAYPLFNTVLNRSIESVQASTSSLKGPSEERERVLALVEAGKITAEDGAELLTALAQSQAASSSGAGAMSGPRRLMLVGAAITLVGFFLPWFTVNLNQMLHEAMSGLQQNMPQFPGNPQPNMTLSPPPNIQFNGTPAAVQNVTQIEVRGGDVQHGLGWIILAASFCSACLPFFWTPLPGNTHQMRKAIFAALGAGSILVLYVLSGSINPATSIESGFVLAIVGYVVLWVGGVREYASFGGRLSPVLAIV
jgi:hypothetical protein